MASFHLFNLFDAPNAAKQVGKIIQPPTEVSFDVTGLFAIEVPDTIALDGPFAHAQALSDAKYAAILASRPGSTNIVYDDMLDAPNFNTSLSAGVQAGAHSTKLCGTYVASMIALGSAPTEFILDWEYLFRNITDLTLASTRVSVLRDTSSDPLTASVSFQNGANPITVPDSGVVTVVPPASQGTQLRVSFTSSRSVYLNSWSICF